METMRKEVKTAMKRTKETIKRQYDKRTSIARGKEHSNKLTLKEARPEMIRTLYNQRGNWTGSIQTRAFRRIGHTRCVQ